jgi:hypothetical protein
MTSLASETPADIQKEVLEVMQETKGQSAKPFMTLAASLGVSGKSLGVLSCPAAIAWRVLMLSA